ncbi:MAG TPA: SRPBCC family protein [Vicinamibacterales bacterium]
MKKWLLYILAGLIGLIALAFAIGAMLPKEHTASRAVRFRPKPADLFAIVSDFAKYPEWRTGVTRVDVEGPVATGTIIREQGANGTIPYRIEVFEPPSKIVTRIADSSLAFGGTWTFEVFQNDSGSELVLTENGEIYNPIFRLLGKFFFSPYETIDTYMADLKKKVGE